MTLYLTLEQVLDYHDRLAGGGPVRDREVIASAVARPQLGFGGHEAHATLGEKAAALLHGLASTQGFEDGNKRTAWIAAVAFLDLNGVELADVPVIEAEAFAMAVAVSAWSDRTVAKAAEWLTAQIAKSPFSRHPQLDYALLARSAMTDEGGTFNALGGQIASVATSQLPVILPLTVVARIFWTTQDIGSEHHLVARMVPESSAEPLEDVWASFTFVPPVHGGHPGHPNGLMPGLAALQMLAVLEQPGRYEVRLHLDGSPLASLPLNVVVSGLLT